MLLSDGKIDVRAEKLFLEAYRVLLVLEGQAIEQTHYLCVHCALMGGQHSSMSEYISVWIEVESRGRVYEGVFRQTCSKSSSEKVTK